jgi:hypothetical protein
LLLSTLKMEAKYSSETLATIYKTTRRHVPEDHSPILFKSVLSSHLNCLFCPAGRSPTSRHEANVEYITEQCKLIQVHIQAVLNFLYSDINLRKYFQYYTKAYKERLYKFVCTLYLMALTVFIFKLILASYFTL